jgi:hypothetical protein
MSRNKDEWKVGDRVQWIDWNGQSETYFGGAITEVITATREKSAYRRFYGSNSSETETFVSKVVVKWDDGEEETLDEYDADPEDTPLEREFRTKAPEIAKLINEKLKLASQYLDEAEAIASEHGIPFASNISPLSQSYMTPTFREKWPDVSKEVMESVTNTYAEYDEYSGWQHSAVCH